ncbi:hypothetical protein H6G51_07765 [Limnothrix sp. FACHB-708]|nr:MULTISPECIES: hypothetical protein [unclassified Limnothrix]MBD2553173.1 hypothetical protein [Limnothrix sp. FACHB-708]MBD2590803.1 hypothetical protein [Limnothrix sp. FACHB-406]
MGYPCPIAQSPELARWVLPGDRPSELPKRAAPWPVEPPTITQQLS